MKQLYLEDQENLAMLIPPSKAEHITQHNAGQRNRPYVGIVKQPFKNKEWWIVITNVQPKTTTPVNDIWAINGASNPKLLISSFVNYADRIKLLPKQKWIGSMPIPNYKRSCILRDITNWAIFK